MPASRRHGLSLVMERILYRPPSARSPARGDGAPLLVAGRRLHAHDCTLRELLEGAGTRIGARRADAGGDLVEQVLDAGPLRVDGHASRGDALFEQPLA